MLGLLDIPLVVFLDAFDLMMAKSRVANQDTKTGNVQAFRNTSVPTIRPEKMVQNGTKWHKMVQNGTKMVQNGTEVQNGTMAKKEHDEIIDK